MMHGCPSICRVAMASVRTKGGEEDAPITSGLHQGSTLSPYLFTLDLDVLTQHTHEPTLTRFLKMV